LIPFEDANIETYRLLLRIEVAIREVLRKTLEEAHGARWRRQLPPDLRKQIHEAETEENRRRQFDFMRLGPLYYLSLGDLLKVLQLSASARAVERIGGKVLLEQLNNIFPPRNALAHSRGVSQAGLHCVRALYSQIEAALTPEGLIALLATPDVGLRPDEVVPQLTSWLRDSCCRLERLERCCPIPSIYEQATQQYWWEMPDVAGFDSEVVDRAVSLFNDYNTLPQGIGSAVDRQRLVETRDGKNIVASALRALNGEAK
jgi:hypothetical protein